MRTLQVERVDGENNGRATFHTVVYNGLMSHIFNLNRKEAEQWYEALGIALYREEMLEEGRGKPSSS